ncbi:MAG TPA: hypothetical protein PKX92_12520 [Edaphocola sp.]|nr:hypothetical protein [Edaphocola sp.]
MKKWRIILLLFVPLLWMACIKPKGKATNEKVSVLLQKNTWRVTEYYKEEVNFSNLLSGYAFTFLSDGSVKAFKNGNTFLGSWKDTISIDSFNVEHEAIKFEFQNSKPINELNKNWEVAEKRTKYIHLKNLEREHGGYNHVFFKLND